MKRVVLAFKNYLRNIGVEIRSFQERTVPGDGAVIIQDQMGQAENLPSRYVDFQHAISFLSSNSGSFT